MTAWDVDETVEEIQPAFEFERGDTGQLQFGCVEGQLDYRVTQRDGRPAVEFSWDGHDESEHVFGRGWAILDGDELDGMIFFHLGDESGFTARRVRTNAGRKRR
ncbi:MAG: hypothetical protein HY288_09105 [Planctomycetia bacterium]|nr:hypothetical protein [Planctomycetia bacterium]